MLLERYARRLRGQAKRFYDRSIDLKLRSTESYATHVPVLVGVAAACKPELLIEFGSGTFSTLSFLDDTAFPSLKEVESYENNLEWFEQVREKLSCNGRIRLHYIDGDMYRVVQDSNTAVADMVFIDDSPSAKARVSTVEQVARRCGTKPVVILHDHDLWRLRWTTRKFENRVSITTFNPQCCIMWHGHPERRPVLKEVKRIIHEHATDIPLTDIRGWMELFTRKLG